MPRDFSIFSKLSHQFLLGVQKFLSKFSWRFLLWVVASDDTSHFKSGTNCIPIANVCPQIVAELAQWQSLAASVALLLCYY
jgi:hypothetical protein